MKSKSANSQTFYNFLSTVLRSGITFLTMPIFTRILGADQYGQYAIYASWLAIIGCFLGLNIKSSLGTGYYHFDKHYREFKSSVLGEGIFISIIMIVCLFVLHTPIYNLTGYSIIVLSILLLEAFAQFVLDFANFSWVYEKNAKNNMLMAVFVLLSGSVLSILLIYYWPFSQNQLFLGRVIGTTIPQVLLSSIIIYLIFRSSPVNYNIEYWKYGLLFGLPMVFHLFSQQVLVQSDRVMMRMYKIDGTEIGRYSFFYSFVAILTTILGALNNSWCPFLYDDLKSQNYDRLNCRIKNYVQIFTVLCLGFLLVSREITYVFANNEYWSGLPLIPILVLVVYVTFIYQFAVNYEIFNQKPRYVAIGTTIAAIANILINAILIPIYGMYGAAIATLASYIILAILHTILVFSWRDNKYPLSYKWVWIGLCSVLGGCAVYYLMQSMIVARWICGIALGIYLITSVYKRKNIF